ncbi:MAG: hypothetical protein HC896_15135 [Bacteroidales bacterium]|nr:hypothetical protein [Bacteroidales bacterium]
MLPLAGSVTGGTTTGKWTSSGDGKFLPSNTQLNALYVPGSIDKLSGFVALNLLSTNNGGCVAKSDNAIVNILPGPEADAGADMVFCKNFPYANLNGTIGGITTTGKWTTLGAGVFHPHIYKLDAMYEALNNDFSGNSIKLVLESTNNGVCSPARDTVTLVFLDPPLVNAGADKTVCENNAVLNVKGSISGITSTGIWQTTGDGMFLPDQSTLNALYVPGSNDLAKKSVELILKSTNNAQCIEEDDTNFVAIGEAPKVFAGIDTTLSTLASTLLLAGEISGPTTSGVWGSSGSGAFVPNTADLNASYVPSSSDLSSGNLQITLTSDNNGGCEAVTDAFAITYVGGNIIYAGANKNVCTTDTSIALNGIVSGATTTGLWSSSGNGSFQNDTLLNTVYYQTNDDKTAGYVYIKLTSDQQRNLGRGCRQFQGNVLRSFNCQRRRRRYHLLQYHGKP